MSDNDNRYEVRADGWLFYRIWDNTENRWRSIEKYRTRFEAVAAVMYLNADEINSKSLPAATSIAEIDEQNDITGRYWITPDGWNDCDTIDRESVEDYFDLD